MSILRLLATGKSLIGMKDAQSPYRMRAENLLPKFESTKNPFSPTPKIGVVKTEPVAASTPATPAVAKVAPMETYPLFDDQLRPAVTVTPGKTNLIEKRLAQLAARTQTLRSALIENIVQPQPAPAEEKLTSSKGRLPHKEANAGLMDASPLGLKTGTPTRASLPAPVLAEPAAKAPSASSEPQPAAPTNPASGSPAPLSKSSRGWMEKLNPFSYLSERESQRKATKVPRTAVQTELSLERVKVVRNDLNDTDLEVVTVRRVEKPKEPVMRLQPVAGTETTGLSRFTAKLFGTSQTLVR